MAGKIHNVLFLCTGNTCRSIIAESVLNRLGRGRFRGFSAGSRPEGRIRPETLAVLEKYGQPTRGLRAKSWDEFAAAGAPAIDIVITLCDEAAVCPLWPGAPVAARWPLPDPALFVGDPAATAAFYDEIYGLIHDRIARLCALPLASLERSALAARLAEIGGEQPPGS